MAKPKTKVTARFSNGIVIERTTTLPLTHAWYWRGLRHPENTAKNDGNAKASNSGFSSSRERAEKALAADAAYISKPTHWNNHKPGTLIFSEVVEVERA
jgi:hypothetical protein